LVLQAIYRRRGLEREPEYSGALDSRDLHLSMKGPETSALPEIVFAL
jgi:hypothetical protein